jgi:signal transduction histidine kinase
LLSNAVKFTEDGEISVRATVGPDGMTAVFTVADTGIGIAPEHLDTIFGDFAQIDSRIQRRVQGTGLGLPLTRKLARLLGGDVSVTSTPGAGSTFVVQIPIHASATGDAAPHAPARDSVEGDDLVGSQNHDSSRR